MSAPKQMTVDEADFTAHSGDYLRALESGDLERVVVSGAGQLYELRKVPSIHGCMKGTGRIMPGVDVTEPIGADDWAALDDSHDWKAP